MEISIQKGTSISLHEQLVTQISMQIASGILKPGAKLPSIRALSQKLGIHHNTCLNAYKELEKKRANSNPPWQRHSGCHD